MKFTLSFLVAVVAASNSLYAAECIYVPKQTPENLYPELSSQGQCGELINLDTFHVNNKHLNSLYFFENGLASIIYEDKIFFVSK